MKFFQKLKNSNFSKQGFSAMLLWTFLLTSAVQSKKQSSSSICQFRNENNPLLLHKAFQEDNPYPNHNHNHNRKTKSAEHPHLSVIGHRGASFNLPEHTLAGYRLAMELQADYIEPDLVPTKDGHLIAMHSVDLNITTDVADKYPDRFRTDMYSNQKEGGGKSKNDHVHFVGPITGYMSFDFTLEEIKTLRVKQRVEDTEARSRMFDWAFEVPTLNEILDLMQSWDDKVLASIGRRRRPGLYPELKTPSFVNTVSGLNSTVEDIFVQTLVDHPASRELFFDSSRFCKGKSDKELMVDDHGVTEEGSREGYSSREYVQDEASIAPLVFQSFEQESLEYLRNQIASSNISAILDNVIPPNVLLVSRKLCVKDKELFWFHISSYKHYIDGIGPDKECLLNNGDGKVFVERAHEEKLAVHAWTTRMDVDFNEDSFQTAEEELRYLYCHVGIDGIFSENVDLAVRTNMKGVCDEPSVQERQTDVNCKDDNNSNTAIMALTSATFGGFIMGITALLAAQRFLSSRRNHVQLRHFDINDVEKGHSSDTVVLGDD